MESKYQMDVLKVRDAWGGAESEFLCNARRARGPQLAACATLPVEVAIRRYCERQAVCYLVLNKYYNLSAGQVILISSAALATRCRAQRRSVPTTPQVA